jgi:hypothetical protein
MADGIEAHLDGLSVAAAFEDEVARFGKTLTEAIREAQARYGAGAEVGRFAVDLLRTFADDIEANLPE